MDKKLKAQTAIFHMTLLVIALGAMTFLITQVNILRWTALFYPVAFGYYTYKHDISYGLVSVLVLALVSALLPDWIWINLLLISGPIGVCTGMVIKRKFSLAKSALVLAATTLVASCLWYLVISHFVIQSDLLTSIKDMVLQMTIPEDVLQNFSEIENSTLVNLEVEAKQLFLSLLPSLLATMMLLYSFLNLLWLDRLLLRLKEMTLNLPPLYELKLPSNIIMGTFIILVFTLLAVQFDGIDGFALMLNVMNLLMVTYSLQGLAVVAHFLQKIGIKSYFQVPILIVGFLIFQFVGLSLLGWLDAIFDIRKLRKSDVGGV